VRKEESDKAIRALCHQWREARDFSNTQADHPSFTDFLAWVGQNDPRYLQFSTSTSADYDAEPWFEEECRRGADRSAPQRARRNDGLSSNLQRPRD